MKRITINKSMIHSSKVVNKQLDINFLFLDLDTCERCKSTDSELNEALSILSNTLDVLGYATNLHKIKIETKEQAIQYQFVSSPTIMVNGIDICNEFKESDCKDCGDLCNDPVDCRVFTYEGKDYEKPPVAMIIDGILRVLYGNHKTISENAPYILSNNLNNYFIKRKNIMKKIYIYEPALCCETGVCGVGVDPELLRISALINSLKNNNVEIIRYNLNNFPNEFIKNTEINKLLMDSGVTMLPATIVEGKIVKTKKYPTKEEIEKWLDIKIKDNKPNNSSGCGCKGGNC